MTDNRHQIYFTLSPSYHGATLLSLLLSNNSNIASLGDTLPPYSPLQICGCGERLSDCKFWGNVIDLMPIRGQNHVLMEHPVWVSSPKLNKLVLLVCGVLMNKLGITYNGLFAEQTKIFNKYILDYYRKDVFLDGSKNIYRYLFVKASGFPVAGAIHLVRDPRAFCNVC